MALKRKPKKPGIAPFTSGKVRIGGFEYHVTNFTGQTISRKKAVGLIPMLADGRLVAVPRVSAGLNYGSGIIQSKLERYEIYAPKRKPKLPVRHR